jgi:myo-inositol-1(or 4)-monophosphatase
MSNENQILELALAIARQAGELLINRPASWDLTAKSTAIDIATQMDHASEKLIVNAILAARPDDGIIGEEGADREGTSGLTWVIDPIDGTVNYFYGLPGWNISIGVKDSQGVLVGVVHSPTFNATWHAARGGGAFLNNEKIECNNPVELDKALIATGFAYEIKDRENQVEIINQLLPKIRDIRRMGAAATDLCCVASGMVDGYIETGLKEWDLAAGSLIAHEAGAVVRTQIWRGMELTIAAGPVLFEQISRAIPE